MKPYHKEEPAQNTVGRELFVSADSDETIPEQMMNIEEKEESEEEPPEEQLSE